MPNATSQDEILTVNEHLALHAVHERFAEPLFALVQRNKAWLQKAMNWPQYVTKIEDTRQTIQSNMMLHQRGYAKMFMILLDGEMVGVLSFNQIEPTNKTAYIGYWLDERHQGRGIISGALQTMMAHYAQTGEVRRFVIKCIVTNAASNRVAQRNGFTLEGRLKEAEYLNGQFHDQHIYARIIDADA
ncbi:50S ribosomal protein L7/L12-serine acetyltransferase [Cronobacter sakazakii]|uniref:50S ribosomal protein L7/L12-serine acetyltransferase n=1 Tax=Cronobacter sakazakii TaxID=28141 RepID=UPI001AE38558|nr:50S ribosomal protein L7/L12-serine acetyltransferase [Cronobacter sakazakii]EKK3979667.1 50S ribosomal protein L7/L12-serine acetyltransferase [Cronobacter sakazakii]EKM6346124.1 50S ribosomal protein L7/L12-serine acetyltransferase [Cronobacter sakazakii]EKM6354039.1 50S ribosomal protein L7/L12-serine acetyltransferase [Cronobacter sakazakii]EKM6370772.1 50S ribosomal protein L7/L12-serine acetyltransferase [Cronobacter sakazakii]EKM6378565.1 50S ribosomal protein L7/L12-serine acetyltra